MKVRVYESDFLTIDYEEINSLFIQNWKISPKTTEQFKNEMLNYISKYAVFKPKYSLWNQLNFELKYDDETKVWIDNNINKSGIEYGNEKLAFVVSKDVLAHINVIQSFEDVNSSLLPKHFMDENSARNWLLDIKDSGDDNNHKKIIYDGVDEEGNAIIKLPTRNIEKAITSISKIIEEENFQSLLKDKINSLTDRENEILKLLAIGSKHKKIADKLSISIHTVRTHIKNIKAKLNIYKREDFLKFLNLFK